MKKYEDVVTRYCENYRKAEILYYLAFCYLNGIGTIKEQKKADAIREKIKSTAFLNVSPFNVASIALLSDLYNNKDLLGVNRETFKYYLDMAAQNEPTRWRAEKLYKFYSRNAKCRDMKSAVYVANEYAKYWGVYSGVAL